MADLPVFILMAIDGGLCYRSRQSFVIGNAIFVGELCSVNDFLSNLGIFYACELLSLQ